MPTELLVVRHGETVFNRQGLYQGQDDSPLTPDGEAQARRLAPRIGTMDTCATLYCSDLGRAVRTAELVADRNRHRIVSHPGLRERSYGAFQGLSRPDIQSRHPDAWGQLTNGNSDYAPPGGESAAALGERVIATFAEIAARHPGERIVVVTHGGVVIAFARHVLGIANEVPRRFDVQNVSLSAFYADAERGWMVRFLGDVGHLT
jgi:probable phosphoglycerate mutase